MIKLFVVLIGFPGAGKGTQASLFTATHAASLHISPGQIYREEIQKGTEMGKLAASFIDYGNFCPDDLTVNIVGKRLLDLEQDVDVVLLDGFPRNVAQAEMFDAFRQKHFPNTVQRIFFFQLPAEAAKERLLSRRVCTACQQTFNIRWMPFTTCATGKCQGEHLTIRADDRPEYVDGRFDTYWEKTYPAVDYYIQHGGLVNLDASQSIQQVGQDFNRLICSELNPEGVFQNL